MNLKLKLAPLYAALLLLLACSDQGRETVVSVLGSGEISDYRGIVSGFSDTYYSAKFVTSRAVIERAAAKLELNPFTEDDLFPHELVTFTLLGTKRVHNWWDPKGELAGGVIYRGGRVPEDRSAAVVEYMLGYQPDTKIAYIVIGYP